ncbi:MAG TPA: flagellar hook capping FlgD N-terminal domain-containing protein [Tepidisphaeraceae bacterium]|jgi:flagellar basal-body rod modification protein FlgD
MSITSTINSLTNSAANAGTAAAGKKKSLEASDFINMMITQLQNQDPTEPTKSADLLAQMSQIGSLQSSTELQSSLKTMTLQNSISNAAALIGKTVAGKDAAGEDMDGVVTSVKVVDGELSLQLDSGQSMSMNNVLSVTPTLDPTAKAA